MLFIMQKKEKKRKKIIRGKSLLYTVAGKKLESFHLSMVSLTVGIEISDFVCRWFLLHVFKLCTQSRSTISLLPCFLTELCFGCVYLYVLYFHCSRLQQQQQNIEIWKYICFFSFKRNPLNINSCYRGLTDNWYLE